MSNTPKNSNSEPTATVSVSENSKKYFTAGKLSILALIMFIILFGVIYGLRITTNDQRKIDAVPKYMDTQQKVEYLSDKGEYSAALKVLTIRYNEAKSLTDKQSILYRQTALAIKFKEFEDAQAFIESSIELLPNTSTPYVSSAQLAEANGKKAEAIKYWEIAIRNLDKNSPSYNLVKRDYESSRDSLK